MGVINYIRYLYGDEKGQAHVGDEFASGILYTGSDIYYSSSEVVGEGVSLTKGASGKIEATLAWSPIVKGTIRIPVQYKDEESKIAWVVDTPKDGTIAVVDVEGKTVEGVATGTIDYTSGKLTVNFTKELEENSLTALTYRYNNLSIGDGAIGTNALHVPQVDIKIESMPVICQSRKLKALYAFDSAYKLQKEYGQDINALLNTQIAAEITHEIDGEIMNDLLYQAELVNESWNKARPEGISLHDHYASFQITLNAGSNMIFDATKRASANFVIVGIDVATVVESLPNFQSYGATTAVGPHVSGTLGNLTVIKNPYYPKDKYVLGYKGMSLFDAGLTKDCLIAA